MSTRFEEDRGLNSARNLNMKFDPVKIEENGAHSGLRTLTTTPRFSDSGGSVPREDEILLQSDESPLYARSVAYSEKVNDN